MIESRFFYSAQERSARQSFAAAETIADALRECHGGVGRTIRRGIAASAVAGRVMGSGQSAATVALGVRALDRCFKLSEAGFERRQDAPERGPAGVGHATLDAAERGRREFGVVREVFLGDAGLFAQAAQCSGELGVGPAWAWHRAPCCLVLSQPST